MEGRKSRDNRCGRVEAADEHSRSEAFDSVKGFCTCFIDMVLSMLIQHSH